MDAEEVDQASERGEEEDNTREDHGSGSGDENGVENELGDEGEGEVKKTADKEEIGQDSEDELATEEIIAVDLENEDIGVDQVDDISKTENEADSSKKEASTLPKRPMSSYFLFLADHRAKVQSEIGGSVASMTKVLGEKWKNLPAEEKKVYEDKAEEAKKEYVQKLKDMGLTPDSVKNVRKAGAGGDAHLPVARIKRLVNLDPQVQRSSAEANHLITTATELFIEYLGKRAMRRAALRKRKGIRAQEFYDAIQNTNQLDFLKGPMKKFFQEHNVGQGSMLAFPKTAGSKRKKEAKAEAMAESEQEDAGEAKGKKGKSERQESKPKKRKMEETKKEQGQRSVADMFGSR
eukprot:g10761.t1